MKVFKSLFIDSLDVITKGSRTYHLWMAFLTVLMLTGTYAYYVQIEEGLIVTGMNDSISWGLYISNFTFLVGVAAAAVMLVLPTYVLKDIELKQAVLIGEGLAVAALVMCLFFVTVDLGSPAKAWHLIPFIGLFNWPDSMLSWDVIVLNGYLFINLTVPYYILYHHYQGKSPNKNIYLPGVFISILWAFGIHLVTAFLYAGLPAKPFWNSSLLGPRFLASAFAAGPALIILILQVINKFSNYKIKGNALRKLALVVTVAAQINIIMLVSELFKEFYAPTHHSSSAIYLFFGLDGNNSLVPWIWTGIAMNLIATIILTIHILRNDFKYLTLSCILLFIGVWIEKGMGLIIPGFIPEAWGDIVEYSPSWIEILVTIGIWAIGAFIFTILAKVTIAIETKEIKYETSDNS